MWKLEGLYKVVSYRWRECVVIMDKGMLGTHVLGVVLCSG